MVRIATLLLCLALVMHEGSLAAEERLRDFHVLGIGINKFADDELDLQSPVRDVYALADYFSRQDFDSGKPRREPRLLFDEKATKAGIERELADLPNWVADGATCAIIISSHGARTGGIWHLTPHDYRSSEPGKSEISGQELMRYVDAVIARRHCRVLLILDVCECGQIVPAAQVVLDKYREPGQGGLILLGACAASQLSWETPAGGIFGTTLLLGTKMMQAHVQPTSSVSIKELRRFLRTELPEQLQFAWWKAPGVEKMEQYSVFEYSLSISEDLGLTWADPKLVLPVKVRETGDENRPPTGLNVIDTDASLVGVWHCDRPLVKKFKGNTAAEVEEYKRGKDGKLKKATIDITFANSGRYSVTFIDVNEREEIGKGRYRFVPGKEFSLTYKTGVDYYSLEKLTADEMVWRSPFPPLDISVLADIRQPVAYMDPVFTFKRVK